jgi:septal ring factor EnvC (AmiA/AmiB activator)
MPPSLKVLFFSLLLLSIAFLHFFCHEILLSLILLASLAEANNRADALTTKLEQSKKARKKAEKDASAVEDLRKRLHDAETSLSENMAQKAAREKEILTRLEPQSRCFVSKYLDPCYFFGSSSLSLLAFP